MIDKLLKLGLHMPNEANAMAAARRTQAPNESDYQAFCSALTSSARGRDFLSEYARRNRNSDTQVLLDALSRLEAHIRADRSAAEQLRDQLRMLLIAIRLARPEIDSGAAPDRMSKLRSLLDMLERRLDVMAQSDANAPPRAAATPEAQPEIELIRARLAVVPRPDEPELPIPSPAAQPPAIALVGAAAIMSSPFDGAASPPEKSQMANTAADKTAPAPAAVVVPAARAAPLPPAADPLMALMALSEDERLALFT
jgi:hypothetical protein